MHTHACLLYPAGPSLCSSDEINSDLRHTSDDPFAIYPFYVLPHFCLTILAQKFAICDELPPSHTFLHFWPKTVLLEASPLHTSGSKTCSSAFLITKILGEELLILKVYRCSHSVQILLGERHLGNAKLRQLR